MRKKEKWGNIPMKGDDTITIEQLNRIENGKNAVASGQLKSICVKGGKIGGKVTYKKGNGLFGMTDKDKKKSQINGGKVAGKLAVERGTVIKAGKISAKSPKHPNNTLEKCIHCGYKTTLPLIRRWHNDNCKHK
jgi:hypothetical protein